MTLWLPDEAYAVLTELAKNWSASRTAVLMRLILAAKGKKLRFE